MCILNLLKILAKNVFRYFLNQLLNCYYQIFLHIKLLFSVHTQCSIKRSFTRSNCCWWVFAAVIGSSTLILRVFTYCYGISKAACVSINSTQCSNFVSSLFYKDAKSFIKKYIFVAFVLRQTSSSTNYHDFVSLKISCFWTCFYLCMYLMETSSFFRI